MAVLAGLLGPAGPARAQETQVQPVDLATEVNDAIFRARVALMADDSASAEAAVVAAREAAAAYQALLPTAPEGLSAALEGADSAVAAGDQTGLAGVAGEARVAILVASYGATLAAVAAGDADEASRWLLVREFSPATRLARPSADSSLALKNLRVGTISAEEAHTIVQADLLDTYQGQLDRALSAIEDAGLAGQPGTQAEAIGSVAGYWSLLSPAYVAQLGGDARTAVDAAVSAVVGSTPETATPRALELDTALENFRAAPLSAEEQSGRARQLMLYIGLVPVEYGRGIRGGEVVADIEIQEAITFLDGAQAAFADLRPSLNVQDPAMADQLSGQLAALDRTLADANGRTVIAEPDDVRSQAEAIEGTSRDVFPAEWLRAGGEADFDVVVSLLEQMEGAVAAGQYKQAESARLEAYAIYDAGPEKRLLAFSPSLVKEIEQSFWQGGGDVTGLASLISGEAPVREVSRSRAALVRQLDEARQRLGAGSSASGAVIFNAATIVFREGLEAVLILASLLASMTGANRRLKRPLAIGALLALAMTAVLFVLARTVLLSLNQYGEKVEAVVSVVAIGVLLLVMNWFFHKVYWTKWIAKHHTRRRVLIGGAAGQAIDLILLGFTSVFREGAETVLFLQALVLDAGTPVVVEGTALGLAGVAVVGVLMFAMQAKLPHKRMLIVTGAMISLVLVTMVGGTVHVLQAVGWVPIHPVGDLIAPYWASVWLGIYATWEGLVGQLVAVTVVVGSYYAAERSHDRSRRQVQARAGSGMQMSGAAD